MPSTQTFQLLFIAVHVAMFTKHGLSWFSKLKIWKCSCKQGAENYKEKIIFVTPNSQHTLFS